MKIFFVHRHNDNVWAITQVPRLLNENHSHIRMDMIAQIKSNTIYGCHLNPSINVSMKYYLSKPY